MPEEHPMPFESPEFGYRSEHEHRIPATIAIAIAVLLYVLLPEALVMKPRYLLPALEIVLIIPLTVSNPTKITRESRNLRVVSLALIGVVNISNTVNLILLSGSLLNGSSTSGTTLLYSAAAIWVTNALVFGLWYWELDRGGPYARCSSLRRNPDFLFPQMTAPQSAKDRWVPTFLDYLYVSFTNALAFSPTDTMPLTPMAKFLMLIQSLISVITVVLVGARAVNILH